MRIENKEQVDYWVKVWQDAYLQRTKTSSGQDPKETAVAMWNRRAKSYTRNSSGKTYQAMQKTVLDLLEFSGVEIESATILDIGCGPGNYTLPLAEKAAHVWALDPSEAMLDIVKTRAHDAGINNITYVKQGWEEVDLAQESWNRKFDLVFASMTPGVNDKNALEKMITAAKGYCYVSRFSGRRRDNLQEKLWPLLSGEPDPWSNTAMDLIYPFNLLYAMGYFPSLKFINSAWNHNESVEKTVTKLIDWLTGYMELTPEVVATIHEFVSGQADDDAIVRQEGEANMGLMVWRV
ncbi:MAG: class I SAM-dependent methyltransferase [Desulfitobacteriaceae bacterium]